MYYHAKSRGQVGARLYLQFIAGPEFPESQSLNWFGKIIVWKYYVEYELHFMETAWIASSM